MDTAIAPDATQAPVAASLYTLLAPFTGYRYRFLLALLKDPTRTVDDVSAELELQHQTVYNWRSLVPGFKAAMEAIREDRPQLRQEYARLAFEGAVPVLADAMIERGRGTGLAAQRAAERILEATGVLPKGNEQLQQAPIQVVTHTYVLVDRDQTRVTGMTVEGEVKELGPSGKVDST